MKYSLLLEKDDLLKLKLLLFIAHNMNKVSVKDCLLYLNITQYKFHQLINELNQVDLKNNRQSPFFIKIVDHQVLRISFKIRAFRELQLKLLKQSINFQVFLYENFNYPSISLKQFLTNHFISRAKFYQIRHNVNDILIEECGLARSNAIQIPNDFLKRVKNTNIFFHFFGGIENPFPQLATITSKFISMLTMTLNLSLLPDEIPKLTSFFQIQLMEIKCHDHTNLERLLNLRNPDSLQLHVIDSFYEKVVGLPDKIRRREEMTYLCFFLVSQGLLNEKQIILSPKVTRYLNLGKKYYGLLLRRTQLLKNVFLSKELISRIVNRLVSLSYWPIFFDFGIQSSDFDPSIGQLSISKLNLIEGFPDLLILAKKIANYGLSLFQPNITSEFIQEVTYGVFQILLGTVPKEALVSVNICLDLDQNRTSSGYVGERIKAILPGNIHISNRITNTTDICLSSACDFSTKQIIQVSNFNPFQMESFIHLMKLVSEIKRKKVDNVLNLTKHQNRLNNQDKALEES
ncbi:hypothetical protein [Lentilactobacillus diolivorans]|uniref:Mga helix-turn-helix domain-containing protein n=1 Tax=Lentilactobacillus diolivorans TaxID=179838 RepID=A0ABQ0XJF0_9LACO|nr:hypothetical protein [Lentilactobacillus diolivorans]GEP24589.1 hypothetical protein LDI01_21820 [Lentilactobacillus diolivorans]